MSKSPEIDFSYSTTLLPETNQGKPLQEIYTFAEQVYNLRRQKYENNTPLLQSVDTPLYKDTEINSTLAYSIDTRNIYTWIQSFLQDTAPFDFSETLTIDLPPETYTHNGEVITIDAGLKQERFRLTDLPQIDFNEAKLTLRLSLTPPTETYRLSFKSQTQQRNVTEEQDTFTLPYDEYQSQLGPTDAEKHEIFAIYSPTSEYQTVSNLVHSQFSDSIILTTEDGWKVCAKSVHNEDYSLDISIVQLLDFAPDEVVEHYNGFSYPTRYIHLPELQYLHDIQQGDHQDSDITVFEEHTLRVLPFAVPYGAVDSLNQKVSSAREFIPSKQVAVTPQELRYSQFLGTTM